MQKLAWERHGFRAANFAGTDSISRFGVAGTLDQIPAVSELPNNDAMQHLITTLQSAQAKLVADISMYDTMYTQNAQQYRELKMTVLAGKKALADFNANQLPALEAEAAASGDAMQAQVLKNFKSKLDRFAKRLDDLDRISVVTLQTAPQIKIIQNADQTIVDKIDTTISTSRFGVAGTLDQIPAVSELPNNDAMQHLITTLQSAQAKLVADISMYDTMYTQNAQQYRELKMTVLAGKKALADFNANQLPALEAEAAASGDAMQAQVLKNFKSKLDRFAKRLDDLDRISVVTLQTAPQIKIIQNADQTIVDKIDTTISTTIPVWKSQMVIALGLSNQRKVLDLQNKADDVTNKLLARNAAALHKGAVDAEKANQRSVVEIDTLEKINAELIATLKETVQIQKEGEANREAAQVKMRQIESDLKNALLENAQQM